MRKGEKIESVPFGRMARKLKEEAYERQWCGGRGHTPHRFGSDRARTMRPGRPFRPPYHPRRVARRRTRYPFHLGRNKEAFDAELFAIHRA